jgi:hypothetical protein
MSFALEQPNANAMRLFIEIADLANANPTCRAAQTNITLLFSDSPKGVRVFPVPVGAMYSTNFGPSILEIVYISF